MPNIFTNLLDRVLPVKKRTVQNARYEDQPIAATVDVDKLHSIITLAQNGDTTQLFALYRDIILSDSHIKASSRKER